jgi:hypothetical protein
VWLLSSGRTENKGPIGFERNKGLPHSVRLSLRVAGAPVRAEGGDENAAGGSPRDSDVSIRALAPVLQNKGRSALERRRTRRFRVAFRLSRFPLFPSSATGRWPFSFLRLWWGP